MVMPSIERIWSSEGDDISLTLIIVILLTVFFLQLYWAQGEDE
jgi:hypothetical protein